MPTTTNVPVSQLILDLKNFRTVPQLNDAFAVEAMISINPDHFWGLMNSLLDDGYLPTENILILTDSATPPILTVKEGNRRVAALKLIYQQVPFPEAIQIPEGIQKKIETLSDDWKTTNSDVPCAVYSKTEADLVDKIISLAHGKGEKAGRAQWNAVARARHNRSRNPSAEPGLDLLEKYLQYGRNRSDQQAARWAGDYPLTVLKEALEKFHKRVGAKNVRDLVTQYPAVETRDIVDTIIFDIGQKNIRFSTIRKAPETFASQYGMSSASAADQSTGGSVPGHASFGDGVFGGETGTPSDPADESGEASAGASTADNVTSSDSTTDTSTAGSAKKKWHGPTAISTYDPKSVTRLLRTFRPVGANRGKVVALRDEAINLDLTKNPLAFCFVLRSMFEISAKAYCLDCAGSGGPLTTKRDGSDRVLIDVLKDIAKHLTKDSTDKPMVRRLHGATAELAKSEGFLSVTSMNQLVHNPRFSITAADICSLIDNVFPLMEMMNS